MEPQRPPPTHWATQRARGSGNESLKHSLFPGCPGWFLKAGLRGKQHPRAAKCPTPHLYHCQWGLQSFLDPPHTTWGPKGPVPYSFTPALGLWLGRSLGKAQVPTPRDHPLLHETFPDRLHPQTSRLIRMTRPVSTSSLLTLGLGHTHRRTPGPSQQGTPLGALSLGW